MKADLLLLITAIIWGFAFVAQRVGLSYMGPFTFNGIRFSLGVIVLAPLLIWQNKTRTTSTSFNIKTHFWQVLFTGLALFVGASLQQVGLIGTSAGKAGFITGLYVIIVPFLALLWGEHTHFAHWVGAILAVIGLYLLSVHGGWAISGYELIVLAGAFAWAVHVHLVGKNTRRVGAVRLAMIQFAICGLLSSIVAVFTETISMDVFKDGIWTILYGSILSVGAAYTLQAVAQRTANPTHAVIILSLEGVFAALGGWLVLNEALSLRGLIGAALILVGTLVSQIFGVSKLKNADETSSA